MIRMAGAAAALFTLFTLFLAGIFIGSPVLLISSLCLWTPAAVFLGWSLQPVSISVQHRPLPEPQIVQPEQMRRSRLAGIKKSPVGD